LLVADTGRFITADDAVVFVSDGRRATRVTPTALQVWSDQNRSVFLPLKPNLAVHWACEGSFAVRRVRADEVKRFNEMVKENAIMQAFASNPADFPK